MRGSRVFVPGDGFGADSVVKRVLIFFVRAYQVLLSPWLGSNCRHDPTCSRYAIDALEEWGAWKGLGLALRRISRCHPWGTQGADPVPRRRP
ncbi:MAG: membrane protein insertion efficiency factor YidD [Flavobacteriales bacterium]